MSRVNLKNTPTPEYTHGGARAAAHLTIEQQLRRSVLSCLLWENEFYEDGQSIGDRIRTLAAQVKPEVLAGLAIEARTQHNLRHVPLLLLTVLAQTGRGNSLVANTIAQVIQRADEMGELLALYTGGGDRRKMQPGKNRTISAQMRKGLAKAFTKFDEYQLAKYDRDGAVKLRDVLRIARPVPQTEEQRALFGRVKDHTLATPDTWEVELSAGKGKKETFERLISEGKLGYLALLRNLRNMDQAGVDKVLVREAILARKGGAHRVLPFRFIAAAKHAPGYEEQLDQALVANLSQAPKLPGRTVVVLDVSGSMGAPLSARSELNRMQAAAALGAVCRELFTDVVVYATAGSDGLRKHKTEMVPARRGMALVDAICHMSAPLGGGGIFLKQVCDYLAEREKDVVRMIVITDEADCDVASRGRPDLATPLGSAANYLINVASYKNGIGYGKWTHIDGFSESVVRYIGGIEGQLTP